MLDILPEWFLSLFSEEGQEMIGYLTNGKHLTWYASVRYTLIAAVLSALFALGFGLIGAALKQSGFFLFRWIGNFYTAIVRGIPDILFILFFPLAIEQGVEYFIAKSKCTAEQLAASGTWPPCQEAQWFLTTNDYLFMACLSLGLVYGAFAANVIFGALQAVPKGQLEAASAYGFSQKQVFWKFKIRQMWVYALPGLSNIWMLLIKATSFLSLLQVTDIVYWAGLLGAANYFPRAGMVHPNWNFQYYFVLFVFYIILTMLSERFFNMLQNKAARGMAVVER